MYRKVHGISYFLEGDYAIAYNQYYWYALYIEECTILGLCVSAMMQHTALAMGSSVLSIH